MHTPGPWHRYGDGSGIAGPDGQPIAVVTHEGATWEANARLIAAAPELLELVNFVLACEGNDYAVDDQWVTRAEAAIEQAEGRQP